jgi:hypothetical protein
MHISSAVIRAAAMIITKRRSIAVGTLSMAMRNLLGKDDVVSAFQIRAGEWPRAFESASVRERRVHACGRYAGAACA